MKYALSLACLLAGMASGQALAGPELVRALQKGGHVILMRHAMSPAAIPTKETANPDNVPAERQLNETGRATATAMGQALRDLKIPIGVVLSSPTYRALETVRMAKFGTPQKTGELGENGSNMQGGTAAQISWLQKRVTQFTPGTNSILVSHSPNVAAAFAVNVAEGEAMVFGPAGLLGHVKIGDWPGLKP